MKFSTEGCEPTSKTYGPTTAVFRDRRDAVAAAQRIRQMMGYAISARLNARYWYVRGHKHGCHCGDCPVLYDDGMVRGPRERSRK